MKIKVMYDANKIPCGFEFAGHCDNSNLCTAVSVLEHTLVEGMHNYFPPEKSIVTRSEKDGGYSMVTVENIPAEYRRFYRLIADMLSQFEGACIQDEAEQV